VALDKTSGLSWPWLFLANSTIRNDGDHAVPLAEYKAATASINESTDGEHLRRAPTASTDGEHRRRISTEMITSEGDMIHNPIIIDNDETIHQWFSPTPEYDPNVIWDLCPSVFTDSDTDTLNKILEDFDQQYLYDPDYQR
jgi:hypothetical protein